MRPLVALLLLLIAPATARAAESAPVTDARGIATLVAESDSVAPGRPLAVGLRLRLAPGWHTYWRNPGDAGIPPELDWTLPAGATAGPIAWPAPERLAEGGLTTDGLTGDVLLAVPVANLGGASTIGLHATWLACAKICVPEEATLRLDLPAGDGTPGAEAPLFRAAEARLPREVPWDARVTPAGVLDVTAPEIGRGRASAAVFFADDPDRVRAGGAQTLALREGGLRLELPLAPGASTASGLAGVLVVTDAAGGSGAYRIAATPVPAVPDPGPRGGPTLLAALGLALLGGLILNLMPCVFPVIALKASAMARLAAQGRAEARRHASAYTLGVVLSFCALGGVLLALRAAGSLAGWGFQLTYPGVVAAMAWLVLAVGLNLSGVFSLDRVPFASVGQGLAGRGGLLGSVGAGVLAVLLATPCAAPFMGAALAAAFAGPPAAAFAIFVALGVGLAAPYALLATLPGAARVLPRPGAWMARLRQVLALPMYGTAAWLLWVVAREAGPGAAAATAAGAVGLAAGLWMWDRARTPRLRLAAGVLAAAALLGSQLAMPPADAGIPPAPLPGAEPFSAARLASLRDAGRPVLVDVSAAWCVTCLVNERVALDRDAVRAALARREVTLLRGDWTRQDPELTAFLRAHGAEGVPLYVFFPGARRPPVVLPQILTERIVLDAISAAET